MDRLTKKAFSVQGIYKTCCNHFMCVECIRVDGHCEKCGVLEEVWEKLERYENIKFDGEEISINEVENRLYELENMLGINEQGGSEMISAEEIIAEMKRHKCKIEKARQRAVNSFKSGITYLDVAAYDVALQVLDNLIKFAEEE